MDLYAVDHSAQSRRLGSEGKDTPAPVEISHWFRQDVKLME